jgi:hypothetical protein
VPGTGELAVICGALVGAGMAFLWYNSYPAEVFMGDTGSLALGGLIGVIAFMVQQPFTLVIVGGVFVWEAVSVIIQVGYFKYTRHRFGVGRRFFLMAPIHHHFQKQRLARDQGRAPVLGALAHVRPGRPRHPEAALTMRGSAGRARCPQRAAARSESEPYRSCRSCLLTISYAPSPPEFLRPAARRARRHPSAGA